MDNPKAFREPGIVFQCEHCQTDVVWLATLYGGRRLFDAKEYSTADSAPGNRFAIQRSTRLVADLENVKRHPPTCLHLHSFVCSGHYQDMRFRMWNLEKPGGGLGGYPLPYEPDF
ncbi:hypothetical protein ACWEOI_30995 [Nocardia sp. NPDC004340]